MFTIRYRWTLLICGLLLHTFGCDRYPHSNPFDSDYSGDFWNSRYAILSVASYELSERMSDVSSRHFELGLHVENLGSSAATDVKCAISKIDPRIDFGSKTTLDYEDILPNDTVTTEWPYLFNFRMPKETKAPVVLFFPVLLSASGNVKWEDTIAVIVEAANLQVAELTIEEGSVNQQERRYKLHPVITNLGSGTAVSVKANISEDDEMIELWYSNVLEFGDIPPGESSSTPIGVSGYWLFLFPADAERPRQTQFIISTSVADSTTWRDTVHVIIP